MKTPPGLNRVDAENDRQFNAAVVAALSAVQTALESLKFSKVRVAAIATAASIADELFAAGAQLPPSLAVGLHIAEGFVDTIVLLERDSVPAVAAAAGRAVQAFRSKKQLAHQRAGALALALPPTATTDDDDNDDGDSNAAGDI